MSCHVCTHGVWTENNKCSCCGKCGWPSTNMSPFVQQKMPKFQIRKSKDFFEEFGCLLRGSGYFGPELEIEKKKKRLAVILGPHGIILMGSSTADRSPSIVMLSTCTDAPASSPLKWPFHTHGHALPLVNLRSLTVDASSSSNFVGVACAVQAGNRPHICSSPSW